MERRLVLSERQRLEPGFDLHGSLPQGADVKVGYDDPVNGGAVIVPPEPQSETNASAF